MKAGMNAINQLVKERTELKAANAALVEVLETALATGADIGLGEQWNRSATAALKLAKGE